MLNKLFAFLKTPEFRKNLLAAFGMGLVLLFSAIFFLRAFTKHGESISLPNFSGLTVAEAQSKVGAYEINFKVDTVYKEGIKPGTIFQQDPDPDTQVKEGRTVY